MADDRTTVALIKAFEADCYGVDDGQLSSERAAALDRYNGALLGTEIPGRSAAVSTDLRDTVEAVLPQLLRIFLSGDDVVVFDPKGPEDEQAARTETDYVNFVVQQRNNAFTLFSTWFRDALLQKNGYVKCWWEERTDIRLETYEGLMDDQLSMLMADPCVQIAQQKDYPDPYYTAPPMQAAPAMGNGIGPNSPPPAPMLHDVVIRRTHPQGFVRVENVPPEELLVHSSTRDVSLADSICVIHKTNKTLSEIRQMGFEVPDDWGGFDEYGNSQEVLARDRFEESQFWQDDSPDPATRRAVYRECFVRWDKDEDGVAELRRICMVNDHVLLDEETDLVPFAAITPVIQPHRHIGYGYYDFLKEIELAHTALLRIFFDNNYLSVNGRYAVDVDRVNVDDLLYSRPGGVVRMTGDPGTAIMPLTHPSTGDTALSAMQYLDAWKKQATGVVMDSSVLSADVLNKSTATGISQAISVWQARIEAVARCFAETGVKDLFRLVHAMTLKHATSDEKVKISGQWVAVNPRDWVTRYDMTVSVGLGTGSKEVKVQFLQQALQMGAQALQSGMPMIQPGNLYEMSKELWKEMGYKVTTRFLTDPTKVQPPQPQPDPQIQVAQIKAQADQQKAQTDAQLKQQEIQAQQQAKLAEQQAALQIQAQNDARDDQRAQREHEREMQRLAMEDARERERMVLDAQLKREEMAMQAHIKQYEADRQAETMHAQTNGVNV